MEEQKINWYYGFAGPWNNVAIKGPYMDVMQAQQEYRSTLAYPGVDPARIVPPFEADSEQAANEIVQNLLPAADTKPDLFNAFHVAYVEKATGYTRYLGPYHNEWQAQVQADMLTTTREHEVMRHGQELLVTRPYHVTSPFDAHSKGEELIREIAQSTVWCVAYRTTDDQFALKFDMGMTRAKADARRETLLAERIGTYAEGLVSPVYMANNSGDAKAEAAHFVEFPFMYIACLEVPNQHLRVLGPMSVVASQPEYKRMCTNPNVAVVDGMIACVEFSTEKPTDALRIAKERMASRLGEFVGRTPELAHVEYDRLVRQHFTADGLFVREQPAATSPIEPVITAEPEVAEQPQKATIQPFAETKPLSFMGRLRSALSTVVSMVTTEIRKAMLRPEPTAPDNEHLLSVVKEDQDFFVVHKEKGYLIASPSYIRPSFTRQKGPDAARFANPDEASRVRRNARVNL